MMLNECASMLVSIDLMSVASLSEKDDLYLNSY